jgi:Arc/MetJ-type ribon-helix-helix transcriptional regulator
LTTKKYTNVALPTSIVEAVRKKVNEPNSFYTSMADLVKEALREKLERLEPTSSRAKGLLHR